MRRVVTRWDFQTAAPCALLWAATAVSGCEDGGDPASSGPTSMMAGSEDDGDDEPQTPPASGETSADPGPTFVVDVLPILQAACSCHRAGAEAGVDLADDAAYETLVFGDAAVGVPLVEPGDPESSYLVLELRGEQSTVGGGGSRMPLGAELSETELATIEEWIAKGAPEE